MSQHPTALERAFALARAGDCPGTNEIRKQLKAEGYATHQLDGPALMRQLRQLCYASVKAKGA
jgi:hypothetical protein